MKILELNAFRRVCHRAMAWVLALLLLSCGFELSARAEADGMIRVKLTRLGAPSALVMRADCDYCLSSDATVRVPSGTPMRVTAASGALTLEYGESVVQLGKSAQLLRVGEGMTGVEFVTPALSNRFCGDLFFTASGDVITTVLNIYVENYLCGAVGYEISPSSGLEALKAQAVVTRNYVLSQKAEHAGSAFDVADVAGDLIFKGYSTDKNYANAVKAVDATRGWQLWYGDALAKCSTTASNGGQTESSENAWGKKLAYSVVKEDPYDLESAAIKRSATLGKNGEGINASLRSALVKGMASQLAAANLSIQEKDVRLDAIESITACDSKFSAPSRLYKSLTFKAQVTGKLPDGRESSLTVTVSIPTYNAFESWYDLSLNTADNETIWVAETDKAFEIIFRRSGSGVGLSQRGAQVMAASYGKSCEEILDFYFPGAALKRVVLEDTTLTAAAAQGLSPEDLTPVAAARLSADTALYRTASEDAAVVANLSGGVNVEIYAAQGEWAAVGADGKYGFVKAGTLAAPKLYGATVTTLDDAASVPLVSGADLLQLPLSNARVLETLSAESTVRLYAYSEEWALVDTPGNVTGFVPVGAVDLNAINDAETPAAEDAIEGGEITKVSGARYMYVKGEGLGMYKSYSEASEQLTTLYQHDRVRVGAYNEAWACVRWNGRIGFVRMEGLTDERPEDHIEGGEIAKVTGRKYAYAAKDGVTVYKSWSTHSRKLAELKKDDRVRVGAYNSQWMCVRVDGVTGFVRAEDMNEE